MEKARPDVGVRANGACPARLREFAGIDIRDGFQFKMSGLFRFSTRKPIPPKKMKKTILLATFALLPLACALRADLPADYKGKPFEDEKYKDGPQSIPGTVECAYYDLGGEGVAYHSMDNKTGPAGCSTKNYGGNDLNLKTGTSPPAIERLLLDVPQGRPDVHFLHQGFCRFHDQEPLPGEIQPALPRLDGEWQLDQLHRERWKKAGKHKIFAVYSNKPNTIKFSINNKPAAVCKLPIDTGYYHHWNRAEIGEIEFTDAGLQLLTFHFYNAPAIPPINCPATISPTSSFSLERRRQHGRMTNKPGTENRR